MKREVRVLLDYTSSDYARLQRGSLIKNLRRASCRTVDQESR